MSAGKLFTGLGWLGIVASMCLGIGVSARVYLQPVDYFTHTPADPAWAAFFLVALGLVFATAWLRRGRFLLKLLAAALGAGLLVPAIAGGLWNVFVMLAALLLSALGLGRLSLRRLTPGLKLSLAELLALGLALGLGEWMLLGLGLGLVGGYTPAAAYAALILSGVVGLPGLWRELRAAWPQLQLRWRTDWRYRDLRLPALGLGALGVCAFGAYLWALAPAIRWDSLSYHLAAPEIYIRAGGMLAIPESFNTYWAHYAEMLYTCALLLAGQPLPGLLHLTAGGLTTLLTFLLARRLAGFRAGVLAAVLFFSLPLVSFESGSTYIDLFVALFITAAGYAALRWWQTGRQSWLFWAGVLAGFGLGCKLNAAIFIACLSVPIGVGLLARRGGRPAGVWLGLLCFGGPVLGLFLPWAVRDALWTGNPLFPFFGSLFPNASVVSGMEVGAGFNPAESWLTRLLGAPWRMVLDSRRYYHEAPGGAFGALPLLALPWLYWKNLQKRGNRAALVALALFGWGALLLYFSVSSISRYLLPIFPILAILAALNFNALRLPAPHSKFWRGLGWGGAALLALGLLFSGRLAELMRIAELPERYPLALALGAEAPQAFLTRTLPVVTLFQSLDRQAGQPKVLSVGVEFRLYTRARIYGLLFAPATRQAVQHAADEAGLARILEQQGFDYILLYPAEQRARPLEYHIAALTPAFLAHYTRLVELRNNIRLYQFFPGGAERAQPVQNLLANPGFELGAGAAELPGWQSVGQPLKTGPAHRGAAALQTYGPSAPQGYAYVFQEVAVQAGQRYTVAYWAMGEPASALQLQVEWLDGQRQPITTYFEWLGLQPSWQYADLILNAPAQAAFARVFASSTAGAAAWIDDVCFAEGDVCP